MDFVYAEREGTRDRLKKRAKDVVLQMLNLNANGKRYLDIGIGEGYFIDEVDKHQGYLIGIEPSKKLYSKFKEREGILNVTIEEYVRKTDAKFDFINLSHVIEHLHQPTKLLHKLRHLLNENGVLYIETPNADSWLSQLEAKDYVFLTPPDHLIIFSISELLNASRKVGFKISRVETYNYTEHVVGILRVIKRCGIDCILNYLQNNSGPALVSAHNKTKSLKTINKYTGSLLAKVLSPIFKLNNKGAISCLYLQNIDN